MKFAVIYASTEGQTRKIARFVCDELFELGHTVEICPAADADDIDPLRFDGIVLGASLHAEHFQRVISDFISTHKAGLEARETLFLAVSLCAADKTDVDWTPLKKCFDEFIADTGWIPGQVEHVAGAFKFNEFNFFTNWGMRWMERRSDVDYEPGKLHEYTNWKELREDIRNWSLKVQPATRTES